MLKNVKLLLTGLVIGTLLTAGTMALADRPVKIFLDRNEIPNANAMIIEGRTYVPLRVISEALGIEVGWDESQWAVKLKRNNGSARNDETSVLPSVENNETNQGITIHPEKKQVTKSYTQDGIEFLDKNGIKFARISDLMSKYPQNKYKSMKPESVKYDDINFTVYTGATFVNYEYFLNQLLE